MWRIPKKPETDSFKKIEQEKSGIIAAFAIIERKRKQKDDYYIKYEDCIDEDREYEEARTDDR